MPVKDHLLQRAKELAYSGRQADARRLVLAVLVDEPNHEAAWLCYGETFTDLDDRLRIYEKALRQGAEMPRIQRTIRQIICTREQVSRMPVPVSGMAAAPVMQVRPGQSFPSDVREAPEHHRQSGGSARWLNFLNNRVIAPVFLGVFLLVAMFTFLRQYLITQDQIRSTQSARVEAGRLQDDVADLMVEMRSLQIEKEDLTKQLVLARDGHNQTLTDLTQVTHDLQGLQAEYDELAVRFHELEGTLLSLQTENQNLVARSSELQSENNNLVQAYNSLVAQKSSLETNYAQLQTEHNYILDSSVQLPYIAVSDRTVHLAFRRTDNSIRYWDFPFELLEESIEVGFFKRGLLKLPFNQLTLETTDGATYRAPDFRIFIDPDPFREFIGQIYREAPDNRAFLNEVWFIVAQLTTYSGEFNEVPRMPLETLLAGGGDCEDTSIIYASMIKAAPVDWEVSIVLMNGLDPNNRHNPNHVAVKVDTGSEVYIVETTDHQTMTPYNSSQVDAWFYVIN